MLNVPVQQQATAKGISLKLLCVSPGERHRFEPSWQDDAKGFLTGLVKYTSGVQFEGQKKRGANRGPVLEKKLDFLPASTLNLNPNGSLVLTVREIIYLLLSANLFKK